MCIVHKTNLQCFTRNVYILAHNQLISNNNAEYNKKIFYIKRPFFVLNKKPNQTKNFDHEQPVLINFTQKIII